MGRCDLRRGKRRYGDSELFEFTAPDGSSLVKVDFDAELLMMPKDKDTVVTALE